MKQLGNLALVCARRPSVLMQIHDGEVAVHVGAGPDRATLRADSNDDAAISEIIRELNFSKYARKEAA